MCLFSQEGLHCSLLPAEVAAAAALDRGSFSECELSSPCPRQVLCCLLTAARVRLVPKPVSHSSSRVFCTVCFRRGNTLHWGSVFRNTLTGWASCESSKNRNENLWNRMKLVCTQSGAGKRGSSWCHALTILGVKMHFSWDSCSFLANLSGRIKWGRCFASQSKVSKQVYHRWQKSLPHFSTRILHSHRSAVRSAAAFQRY